MLRFRFEQFVLAGRYHVPLPKMVPGQMEVVRRRLESLGFATYGRDSIRASKRATKIVVGSSGLASSNEDLSDAIAPVLPEVLACRPNKVDIGNLMRAYFASEKRGGRLVVRVSPRLESESYWDELRSKGSCALTPDERVVYTAMLSSRATATPLVTDFPTEGSAVKRIGRKQYYASRLEPHEAASTLRGLGSLDEKNTYLPRNSLLSLNPASVPKKELGGAFRDLGDWCYLKLGRARQKL